MTAARVRTLLMLTFATKKLSIGTLEKEDFDPAVTSPPVQVIWTGLTAY